MEEEDEEEMEEEVSSEESLMNQFDTSKEKLLAKCGHSLCFSNDGDTTSPSSRVRTDPDGSDDDDGGNNDDDDFWM
jgi:hypothetical protein